MWVADDGLCDGLRYGVMWDGGQPGAVGMVGLLQFLFSFDQKGLFIKVRGSNFAEKDGSPTTIGRIFDTHADVFALEEFLIAGFGVLEEASHDTDASFGVPDFQELTFLKQDFSGIGVD